MKKIVLTCLFIVFNSSIHGSQTAYVYGKVAGHWAQFISLHNLFMKFSSSLNNKYS